MRRSLSWITFSVGFFAGSAAEAQILDYFSLTLTGVTDYEFRGISQSANDAAFQGSLDFEHDSGFYAGWWWSSSLDFDQCCGESWEFDYYGGFANEIGETGIGYDVGVVKYDYPGVNQDIDYTEFWAGLSYKFIDFKLWWTPNFFSVGPSARYHDLHLNFELPYDFGLVLHGGFTDGRALDPEFADLTGLSDYFDYSVALSRSLGPIDFELKWLDTDLSGDFKISQGALQNDSRWIFTVSTTLPWDTGDDEE